MCSRTSLSEGPCVNETWTHTTVLLNPAVQALNIRPHLTYVDGTFGRGGHSRLILSLLSAQGRLIAYDKDPEAVNVAKQWGESRLDIHHGGFAHMAQLPAASVAGILLDLGVSSPQITTVHWTCAWTAAVGCRCVNGWKKPIRGRLRR
jgi:16S rRNA (cytosine1402-N4)-methyltransferase